MMENNIIIDTSGDIVYDSSNITISNNNYGISMSCNKLHIDLDYVDNDIIKDYLKNNPELLNDIIKDLRKEKINKIKKY